MPSLDGYCGGNNTAQARSEPQAGRCLRLTVADGGRAVARRATQCLAVDSGFGAALGASGQGIMALLPLAAAMGRRTGGGAESGIPRPCKELCPSAVFA